MGRHESVCPTCGRSFQAIGRHWAHGDCDYPPISGRQKELIAGLLAGDGSMRMPRERDGGKGEAFPKFELEMTNAEFVEWVARVLEPFTSNVGTRSQTGKRDTTRMYTVGHPDLQVAGFTEQMARPSSLAFEYTWTPTTLNALYCTRGSLNWVDGGATIRMSVKPRYAHLLERFFRERGWAFNNIRGSEYYLRRADTKAFFNYLGDPFPGFGWKWRHDDEAAYREGAPTRQVETTARSEQESAPDPSPGPDPVEADPERIVADHDDYINVSAGQRPGKKVHILRRRADGYYERVCGRHDGGLAFGRASRRMTADSFLRLSNRCLACERVSGLPERPLPRELDFDPVAAGLLTAGDDDVSEPSSESGSGESETVPETISLEPDWEWLASELDRLGFPEWAADARTERLTPRQVYGPILTTLYRARGALPQEGES